MADRVVRGRVTRLLEPRLLSRLIEALVPVVVQPKLRPEAPQELATTAEGKKKTTSLEHVLGAKWARKLNAALSSMAAATPKRRTSEEEDDDDDKATLATEAAGESLRALCAWLELWLPAAGPRRRFEALNALAFHRRRDVVRALYQARDESTCWYLLSVVTRHAMVAVDADDLEHDRAPLSAPELRRLALVLKEPLFDYCWSARSHHAPRFEAVAGLLDDLRGRRIAKGDDWLVSNASVDELRRRSERSERIRRLAPMVLPFEDRAKVFFDLCGGAKNSRPDATSWLFRSSSLDDDESQMKRSVIRVRRSRAFEDGLAALGQAPADAWRGRLVIHFVDELTGGVEAGLDGGGLFKEFVVLVCGVAFSPDYGLFKRGADGRLYPNPNSRLAAGPDHLDLFSFVGALVGKALREGVAIQPRLNKSFLRFVRRRAFNPLGLLEELDQLDPELYRNLKFLRLYPGDCADLCLTMSVSDDISGQTQDLVPGGAAIAVDDSNKHAYVHLVARHHLVDRLQPQATAFVSGLAKAVDLHLLGLFDEPELQHLVSGPDRDLDVDDLAAHTRYENFLQPVDARHINRFWTVVKSLDSSDKAKLLHFATSCDRPPPLGFANLHPPFTLRKVPNAPDRLPTASTCFNTLKLPIYPNATTLKTKLLTAIRAQAGFDLS